MAVGLEMTYYDAEQAYEVAAHQVPKNPPCRVRLALTLRDTQRERAFTALSCRAVPDNEQTRRVQTSRQWG
jgi:hypothetical protein